MARHWKIYVFENDDYRLIRNATPEEVETVKSQWSDWEHGGGLLSFDEATGEPSYCWPSLADGTPDCETVNLLLEEFFTAEEEKEIWNE